MAILLFSLRGVSDDEALEIRTLLTEQEIDFYETSAGNWGISMPAFWLRDHGQLELARQLLGSYQQQRFITAREAYLQSKQAGGQSTLLKSIRTRPLTYCVYWLGCLLVAYVSVRWVFELGAW
ncbi:MAG: DUF6164 family protein [Methylovulum sp.]|nr:DUF6164 family protein [Methylovulum sp.]